MFAQYRLPPFLHASHPRTTTTLAAITAGFTRAIQYTWQSGAVDCSAAGAAVMLAVVIVTALSHHQHRPQSSDTNQRCRRRQRFIHPSIPPTPGSVLFFPPRAGPLLQPSKRLSKEAPLRMMRLPVTRGGPLSV
ncbi:hypothetical protein XA68_11034 [Ophiocordyceps unilateralis]|uniref:Uncharacterized protein n=1 Tax=Ophiocordyceps unilateralis TaxID=268505 RepID=A0A2A9PHM3_OPHUN|nr:hypothetical protein XA68_11034 [Ophiocordyceps unilateralis]